MLINKSHLFCLSFTKNVYKPLHFILHLQIKYWADNETEKRSDESEIYELTLHELTNDYEDGMFCFKGIYQQD